jgi:hypothetical protein
MGLLTESRAKDCKYEYDVMEFGFRRSRSPARRNHEMEGVRFARAVCRWIRQWIDNLQLLDDRAGPSVRDDERQRFERT